MKPKAVYLLTGIYQNNIGHKYQYQQVLKAHTNTKDTFSFIPIPFLLLQYVP